MLCFCGKINLLVISLKVSSFVLMMPLQLTPKSVWVALSSLLLVVGCLVCIVCLGNQQGLQESVMALRAIQPSQSSGLITASCLESPLFRSLMGLLQAFPVVAQVVWVLLLGAGFLAMEAIGKAIASPSTARRLFLGLVSVGSLWGFWQLSTLNFQTYATIGILCFCWLLLTWFTVKTAPTKGDTLPPWQPVWVDLMMGGVLALMAYEQGSLIVLLLLGSLLFRHQQISTVLPATWQVRSIATLRWLWIGLVVGLVAEGLSLRLLSGICFIPPLLRLAPILPEWTGWQTNFSGIGYRGFSLVMAFFPWGFWLLSATWDLWLNVQKGGAKVSFFLESERQPLRFLSLIGVVFGLLWLIFPVFWVGWSVFLLSHSLILADWLSAACNLPADPLRFKRGFLWLSLFLLGLGLFGLVWENHSASFQLSPHPFKMQLVQTLNSLWCVLGGCFGLLCLWRGALQPKQSSIAIVSWFAVWMVIQTLGVVPLLADDGGNRSDIETSITSSLTASTPMKTTVGVCLDKQALGNGAFPVLLGNGSTGFIPRHPAIVYQPLSVSACLRLSQQLKPNVQWLLMPESIYYENKKQQPHWQSPLMGLSRVYYRPVGMPLLPALLHPLLLPFMVPQQVTAVLIPVQSTTVHLLEASEQP
jgi:hypothetical protein